MEVYTDYTPVGNLFGHDRTFLVPKYQRNYAWQAEEIGDFKSDLKRCLEARKAGKTRSHFFGGIVTVRKSAPGRQELEIVDGQQRLATIVLLVSQLRSAMELLADGILKDDPASEEAKFLQAKAGMLKARFQLLQTTVNMKVVGLPRLQLSGPDREFFGRLNAGENPEVNDNSRQSHRYLKFAYDQLGIFLNELTNNLSAKETAQRLDTLALVVEEDWTILNLETPTKEEAYTLFQVLNDRGRGLTEGELLRAKTLELLDGPGTTNQSTDVEDAWDEILANAADAIEDNFRWIYASHLGKRPSQTQLFDDLLRQFFPTSTKASQSAGDAEAVVASVKALRKDCALATSVLKGDWPYTTSDPAVTVWDKDWLRLLTVELDHSNCMPLLIAAASLSQKQFAEVVQLLERFVFRYKLVVSAHIGPATSSYHKQALEIRANPGSYKVQSLKAALKALIDKHADDGMFGQSFERLLYGTSPGKKIKYALLTLEHYRKWLGKGAKGNPVPDKTLVYDFPNTTVEHVYPLSSASPSPEMDEYANNIGNLAILGPNDNNSAGNKAFADKKEVYKLATFSLTRDLHAFSAWDKAAILKRASDLKNMALQVFVF